MIGLDTWEGFLVLLIAPLLYWLQRSRSALKEVPLSIYPVITQSSPEELPPPKHFLRLTRNQRFFLFTGVLLSLALCFNGIHTKGEEQEPGKWLVFFDNTSGVSAEFKGRSVLKEITSGLKMFSGKTHEADNFALVTTSPSAHISDNLDHRSFLKELDEIKASPISGNIDDLESLLRVMVSGDRFKGAILVSPRSRIWKEKFSVLDLPHLTIPENLSVLSGNAGFVLLDITPVANDLYEVYGKIVSHNLGAETVRILLRKDDGSVKKFSAALKKDGEGSIYFTETFLPGSRSTLNLEIDDNILFDNSVTILPPDNQDRISIRLKGVDSPFLKIALSSYGYFNLITENNYETVKAPINILNKTVPGSIIDSPTLVIFPPEDFMNFKLVRVWAAPMNVNIHPAHPATRNARFRQFRAGRILQTSSPEGFETLATAEGIPAILAGTLNSHRTVIWNFNPEDNGIFLDPGFPILLRDTITWLAQSKEVRIESDACPGKSMDPQTCSSLAREAGIINIPDMKDLRQNVSIPASENRRELGDFFLFIALFLILVLAVERVPAQGAAF